VRCGVLGSAAAALLLAPRLTQACEVCFGSADSPWIDASRAAVWLLLGVTVAVQGTFVFFFVSMHRRAKALGAHRAEIKLVEERGAA
jgi:hypothetical protein